MLDSFKLRMVRLPETLHFVFNLSSYYKFYKVVMGSFGFYSLCLKMYWSGNNFCLKANKILLL